MNCPHCGIAFHESWDHESLFAQSLGYHARGQKCPDCKRDTIEIKAAGRNPWIRVYPVSRLGKQVHQSVPPPVAKDYEEGYAVLAFSPKAAAALARRCIQAILQHLGYSQHNLVDQIKACLSEPDPSRALPTSVRSALDATRHFGNFGAHPMSDTTTLQLIEVDAEEAEWCLQIVEEMFDAVFVGPYVANERKAALDAKLKAAGKKPSL